MEQDQVSQEEERKREIISLLPDFNFNPRVSGDLVFLLEGRNLMDVAQERHVTKDREKDYIRKALNKKLKQLRHVPDRDYGKIGLISEIREIIKF